jgi:hypothetical protein
MSPYNTINTGRHLPHTITTELEAPMPPSQLALDGGMDQASFSVLNFTVYYST